MPGFADRGGNCAGGAVGGSRSIRAGYALFAPTEARERVDSAAPRSAMALSRAWPPSSASAALMRLSSSAPESLRRCNWGSRAEGLSNLARPRSSVAVALHQASDARDLQGEQVIGTRKSRRRGRASLSAPPAPRRSAASGGATA